MNLNRVAALLLAGTLVFGNTSVVLQAEEELPATENTEYELEEDSEESISEDSEDDSKEDELLESEEVDETGKEPGTGGLPDGDRESEEATEEGSGEGEDGESDENPGDEEGGDLSEDPEDNRVYKLITTDAIELDDTYNRLYPDVKDVETISLNTVHLQKVMDLVSEAGGGTVVLPAGDYYFYPLHDNSKTEDGHASMVSIRNRANHVIYCRSNVTLVGAGQNQTILNPCIIADKPTDMFYYGKYIETKKMVYLENAHFENFTIDASQAENVGSYNSKGKGFYFTGYKDCTWKNVTVKNTDGTGFGMDFPVNARIENCTAINCGVAATTDDFGASGFGIGVGYSKDENCEIINCVARNCRKFGFFFENQARFGMTVKDYIKTGPLVVRNCVSSGNLYGFGSEMCMNTHFYDCYDGDASNNRSQKELAYYFGTKSSDYHLYANGEEVSAVYGNRLYFHDIEYGEWFVRDGWFYKALNKELIRGYSKNGELTYYFGPEDEITRAQVAMIMYRSFGQPKVDKEPPFTDINKNASYYPAVKWAYASGVMVGSNDLLRPDDPITRQELATVIYRCYGKGQTAGDGYKVMQDADEVKHWAQKAIAWCYENGVMKGIGGTGRLELDMNATRSQACKMILVGDSKYTPKS